jgi:hypothetical protein
MKKLLPYVIAAAVFAAVTMVCFAPQFEGRRIVMHDVMQYEGTARDVLDNEKATGEDSHWSGTSFGGSPTYLSTIKYPGLLFKWVFKAEALIGGRPASLIFIAMAAFFAMLVMMRCRPWVALAPSLAYGLSTYFMIIIAVGHIGKMAALAYAPLLIGAVWMTLRRNMWLGAALSALFGAILLATNHPQIVYYFMFILVAMWVNELVRAVRKKTTARFAKASGALVVAAVLAVGAYMAPLWYLQEYSRESIRGGSELSGAHTGDGLDLEYATQWSYGVGETVNMYIPYLNGGSSEGNFADDGAVAEALTPYGQRRVATQLPSYWGPQPMTSGPTYVGAAALFMAVLALFMLPRRRTLWVSAVSVLAIMLAWGSHFMPLTRLFFEYFPAYDKFRTVAMILVIVEWTVPLLGALALNRLWREADDSGRLPAGDTKVRGALKYTVCVLGGISLFLLLFGGTLFDFAAPYDTNFPDDIQRAMQSERASMMRSDAFRSLVFVLLGAAVVWLYAARKIGRVWVMAALAVLVVVDLGAVDGRFLPHSKFEPVSNSEIKPTAADLEIMEDKELGYRVMNLTVSPFNDATTSNFHRSVGGYSAAKLQRYQDVIDRYLVNVDQRVLDMLNVRYLITPDGVVANPDANGAAWFVERATGVPTADEEIAALASIDSRREIVVDERFAHHLTMTTTTADSVSWIRLTEYRPNYLKYEYSASDETFAIFSEIYYPRGWQAYIDGQPAEHFRADYILRAMVLPAGEHTVEFRFRSLHFDAVNNITLIFSLVILVCLGAAITATVKCRKTED